MAQGKMRSFLTFWLLALVLQSDHVAMSAKIKTGGMGGASQGQGQQPPTDGAMNAETTPTSASTSASTAATAAVTAATVDAIDGMREVDAKDVLMLPFAENLKIQAPSFVHKAFERIMQIVTYKPPIGIVTAFVLTKLLLSGTLLRLVKPNGGMDKMLDKESQKRSRRRRHRGRAFMLDKEDRQYQQYGGIEHVRQRLCVISLLSMVNSQSEAGTSTGTTSQQPAKDQAASGVASSKYNDVEHLTATELLEQTLKTVRHTYASGSSMTEYVQHMAEDYVKLESMMNHGGPDSVYTSLKGDEVMGRIVAVATATAESRLLDAMLRLCRDRLLQSAFRISKSRGHWQRRVEQTQQSNPFMAWMLPGTATENDRIRLAFADNAYNREVTRLGTITQTLANRPAAREDQDQLVSATIGAVRYNQMETKHRKDQVAHADHSVSLQRPTSFIERLKNVRLGFSTSSRYKLSLVSFENSSLAMDSSKAIDVLATHENMGEWLSKSDDWCKEARKTIVEILEATAGDSSNAEGTDDAEWDNARELWWARQSADAATNEQQWNQVLNRLRSLSRLRRIGEGQVLRFKDTTFFNWIRQYELQGLFVAAAQLGIAHVLYRTGTLVKLHAYSTKIVTLAWTAIKNQVWIPFRELIEEIFNPDKKSMIDSFSLTNEGESLDNMLKDLEFGDGTPDDRIEGLQKASRQFESDIANRLIWHALTGRLVRLIFVQVQQLKVGLISAISTIDVLLQANQVLFKLIAIVPSVIFIVYGTRFFARFLYNFRAKDLRSITSVHTKMTEYVNTIQEIFLTTEPAVDGDGDHNTDSDSGSDTGVDIRSMRHRPKPSGAPSTANAAVAAAQQLKPAELGQLMFALHQYLLLLDYVTAGFSKSQCDSIHNTLMSMVGTHGTLTKLNARQHVPLMRHVKEKHLELVKHM